MRERGFSLIEIVIVVGLIATALAVVAALALPSRNTQRSNQALQELQVLTARARVNWQGQLNYATLTQAQFAPLVPARMRGAGTTVNNAFGGTWAIAPITWSGDANAGFALTQTNVPQSACAELVVAGAPLVHSVQIDGNELKSTTSLGARADAANASTRCNAAVKTIVWRTL